MQGNSPTICAVIPCVSKKELIRPKKEFYITDFNYKELLYSLLTASKFPSRFHRDRIICGQEWIRTTEVVDSGFTVRPIWPLWNLSEPENSEPVEGFEPPTS